MPLVNDIYSDEPMGRKKHGGPLVAFDPPVRSDGQTNDHGGFQSWSADGSPFVRIHFRAAPDTGEKEDDYFRRKGDTTKRITDFIDEYKTAMINSGQAEEIHGSSEARPFKVDEELPEEAVETMRRAFAEKDTEAMAQAMIKLSEFDPTHKSFDDRIAFWTKEFSKAWSPAFEKDRKEAKDFVLETLDPFMPPQFKEMENDRKELEKYEEKKAKALEIKKQKAQEAGKEMFPDAIDLTDSALSVIQAKSSSMEWETRALMGAHPGVMFGAHCAGTFEEFDFRGIYGDPEFADPWAVDFARRYPKTKGRSALPSGYE